MVDPAGKKVGHVYVLREGDGMFYKIGNTEQKTVRERISDIQAGNPRKLNIEQDYIVKNKKVAEDAEEAAQKAVVDYHVTDLGGGIEWYKVEDADRDVFFGNIEIAIKESSGQWSLKVYCSSFYTRIVEFVIVD